MVLFFLHVLGFMDSRTPQFLLSPWQYWELWYTYFWVTHTKGNEFSQSWAGSLLQLFKNVFNQINTENATFSSNPLNTSVANKISTRCSKENFKSFCAFKMIQERQFENSTSGIYILQFIFKTTFIQFTVAIIVYWNSVKPLSSGHPRVLKYLSVIKRCPLSGGSLTKIVTFGTKHFVRY